VEEWEDLKQWINKLQNGEWNIQINDIIFGIFDGNTFLLNFVILHAKWWIHKTPRDQINIVFYSYISYLKKVVELEKAVANRSKNIYFFQKHFGKMFENEI